MVTKAEISKTINEYPEEFRDRARAMIPHPDFADDYTSRYIKGHRDFDYFTAALELFHNVLFEGPTGSGKTTAAKAYASFLQWPFVRTEFSRNMNPMDVLGRRTSDEDRKLIFDPGDAFIALNGPSVWLLDEVSNMHQGNTAFTHGVLDAGASMYVPQIARSVPRHNLCAIFGAYNPGYAGTVVLSPAFRNRWAFPMEWGYDPGVEDIRVGAHSATLLQTVRGLRNQDGVTSDISTNSMEEYIHVANKMSIEAATYLFTNKFESSERLAVQTTMEAEAWTIAGELGLSSAEPTE